MDREQIVLLGSAAVAVLALLLAALAHRRLSKTRRSLTLLQGTFEGSSILEAVAAYVQEVRALRDDVRALTLRQEEFTSMLAKSARNVGVTRYDAFEDMGGQMSFSAALLDDQGNGIVVTAINGRTEARTYAKMVEGGESDFTLSPEERQAITEALARPARLRR
ncbi:MAG: DUF4446 family protein [Actinomycetota bacterium]|jgi:uncharacterized protein YlxW (UPF0749 family)